MPRIGLVSPALPVNMWIGPEWAPLASAVVAFTANQAHLNVFTVKRPVTVTTASYRIGVQSGNIDLGIYNDAGTRLASTGTTACPAPGPASTALTASVTLIPGVKYWAAVAIDNATATFGCVTNNTLSSISGYIKHGVVATSFPLPAPIVIPTVEGASPCCIQFN